VVGYSTEGKLTQKVVAHVRAQRGDTGDRLGKIGREKIKKNAGFPRGTATEKPQPKIDNTLSGSVTKGGGFVTP